ncbi:MAG: flagellar basal body-associated FliL family protein [Balneolaceae bacterium]|nr:flagellar basal body-associated FliL family protein [Balneolaceae bacterium]MCH8547910.1 flagellar basal body-associated FliL family protein [Balneolaceae bacterium]
MAAKEKKKKEKKKKGGVKFAKVGKYFLLLLIIAVQGVLAYAIADRNYDKVYGVVQNVMKAEYGQFDFEELIVNPAQTNGQRYLVVEISVELEHIRDVELVEKNKQKIRHEMNQALGSRTVDQLGSFDEREYLRRELAEIINRAIDKRSVRNLYYTRYVMQ